MKVNSQKKNQPIETLKNNAKNSTTTFSQTGGSFSVILDVRAVSGNSVSNLNDSTIVGRNAGYVFVQYAAGEAPPANSVPAVVTQSGLGAVTGNIKVAVSSNVAGKIAADYNLNLIQSFDQIGVSYFQSNRTEVADLVQLQTSLQQDARVKSQVDIEIANKTFRPN